MIKSGSVKYHICVTSALGKVRCSRLNSVSEFIILTLNSLNFSGMRVSQMCCTIAIHKHLFSDLTKYWTTHIISVNPKTNDKILLYFYHLKSLQSEQKMLQSKRNTPVNHSEIKMETLFKCDSLGADWFQKGKYHHPCNNSCAATKTKLPRGKLHSHGHGMISILKWSGIFKRATKPKDTDLMTKGAAMRDNMRIQIPSIWLQLHKISQKTKL